MVERLRERIDRFPVTDNFICRFMGEGWNATKLARGLRREIALTGSDLQALDRGLRRLEALKQRLAPIPVEFRDPELIRKLAEKLENGSLTISVYEAETVEPAESFHVFIQQNSAAFYFKELTIDGAGRTSLLKSLNAYIAPVFTEEVANEIVQRLAKIDLQATAIRNRNEREEVIFNIEDVWPTMTETNVSQ